MASTETRPLVGFSYCPAAQEDLVLGFGWSRVKASCSLRISFTDLLRLLPERYLAAACGFALYATEANWPT